MKPVARALLVLLALPLWTSAQQVPDGPEQTHVVSSGETLGDIAARYLGAASAWELIFEANRDLLADPDVLPTGVTLVIPGATTAGGDGARVTDVAVREVPTSLQDVTSLEDRRALLRTGPFQPAGQPSVPSSERTVFYDPSSVSGRTPSDEAESAVGGSELPPAVPMPTLYEAGWIVPTGEAPEEIGIVREVVRPASVAGRSVGVGLGEDVRIERSDGGSLQVGDQFLTYWLGPPIEDIGRIAWPSGVVEVTRVGDAEATARVTRFFERIHVGHLLGPLEMTTLEPGVYATETSLDMTGTVIALPWPAELPTPRTFAFVDLGADVGLQIGDEFVGVAADRPEWADETVARFQVVDVREETSTVMLLSTREPKAIRPGLRVVLDRRMP